MDMLSIGAAVQLVKGIPGSAAGRAESAATRAEAAAEEAASHNYGISISGTTLTIAEPTA